MLDCCVTHSQTGYRLPLSLPIPLPLPFSPPSLSSFASSRGPSDVGVIGSKAPGAPVSRYRVLCGTCVATVVFRIGCAPPPPLTRVFMASDSPFIRGCAVCGLQL
jgi:hypothetical protein